MPVSFVEMAALSQNARDISAQDIEIRTAKAAGAHFQNGDTLLARITPCLENGKTALVRSLKADEIGEGSTEFIVLCGKEAGDNEFIYYLCRSPSFREFAISRMEGTSGRQRVSWQSIASFEFDCPAPDIRRAGAALLTAVDDRIELLRQTNATLESIAQALFKSWFIDFDPVRAKAEGREPEGLDAAMAALFPAEFEESALGLIPKGWWPGRFGDLAELSKGSVNPLAAPNEVFEHYSLPAFDSGQLPVFERGDAIKSNKTRVPAGAVLQSKLNPHIPRVWLPSRIGERAVCSTEFLPWVAKRSASSELIYCILTGTSFKASVRTLVTGTSNSHQRVRPDQVAALELVVAPDAIFEAFTQAVRPLLSKVGENRLMAKGLAELRDTLLPRLISGELRLPEAEAAIEPVA